MNPQAYLWLAFLAARQDSIVVTGSPDPIPLEEADRSVRRLQVRGQELLFNTFVDLLQLEPSLDLRQRGPSGTQADLSIRGSTFGQTLVLLNGRRMNDAQSGHHNLDLPVPLESVEAVEILKGAGSSLYGADAMGGVVNVITRPPEQTEIRIRGGAGNFGAQQQRISLAGRYRGVQQQLSLFRDFSSGFMANRDFRNAAVMSGTRWNRRGFGGGDLDLAYSDRPFGADRYYGNFNSWERTKTWYAGLRQALGERTETAFSFRRHTDLFVLYRDRPQVYTNHHIAQGWQGSLRRRDPLSGTATLFSGVEAYGEGVQSSNLGQHGRGRAAVYANYDQRVLRRASFSAGVRGEVFRGLPGQWAPSLAGGLWLHPRLKLRASVSRAFRLPTYTDLYYMDPANRGNAALRPESAWSTEAGFEWRPAARWRTEAALFHRRERDGIDYVRPSPEVFWQATNIQQLRFTGLETALVFSARAQVFDFRYTGLRGIANALPGLQSKYVFNYPVHSGVFGWQARLMPWLAARMRVGALERKARDPYAVWDASLAATRGRIRPYLQFTNLSNTRYAEIIGVVMPGRAFLVGAEIQLR